MSNKRTPIEHYRRAETLLDKHADLLEDIQKNLTSRTTAADAAAFLQVAGQTLHAAQVHATLATVRLP